MSAYSSLPRKQMLRMTNETANALTSMLKVVIMNKIKPLQFYQQKQMRNKSPPEGKNYKSLLSINPNKKVSASKDKTKEQQSNLNTAKNSNNNATSIDVYPKSNRSSVQIQKSVHSTWKEYMQYLIKELHQKKEQLQACVKMFSMFQTHSSGLRCVEHNNTQTVYCLTQRRVLCTNCVFGAAKHRTHKLKPLKDSHQYIQQDNKLLNKIIETDLINMNQSIKNSQFNTSKLESQLKFQLERLEEEYRRKKDFMEEKYSLEKEGLKRVFGGLIQNSKLCERYTQELKFKTWEASSKLGINKSSDAINMQASISRQVFLVKISEITQLKVKSITDKQIDKINKSILKS